MSDMGKTANRIPCKPTNPISNRSNHKMQDPHKKSREIIFHAYLLVNFGAPPFEPIRPARVRESEEDHHERKC
jgi:hypothetical protein